MPDRVAIVEDDPDQRALIERGLRHRGFAVVAYSGRQSARSAFAAGELPDLAIFDVNLAGDDPDDRDGFALCRELQELPGGEQLPVIFLSRLEDHRDRLTGLALAVAWMQKPPDLDELAQQIHSLLGFARRLYAQPPEPGERLVVGELVVDRGASRATWRGRPLDPTYSEFEILAHLAERPGRVASFVDLHAVIGSNVADNTIATHIKNLRDRFSRVDPDFPRTRAIRAVPKRGYVWEGP